MPDGWKTPNGALLIPAPEGYERDKQLMVVPIRYRTSAALLRSAMDPLVLDIVEAVLGPDIELFGDGQALVKEPVRGHAKHLHQDASCFVHRFEGPVGCLTYAVDTDLNNGCLHVVPGSHVLGLLDHEDTSSHLRLDGDEWPRDRSVAIEGCAGDSILFHVNCIHGSKPNHSGRPRPVFIHRYRRADDYFVVHATSTASRAEAEKHREEATRMDQLGLMVRGFRPYTADR